MPWRSRSTQAVRPISALADLYSAEGMEEEAISLYKQATPLRAYLEPGPALIAPHHVGIFVEKDVSGEASLLLAAHLQKLGAAYEKQGKMEAATLTLEEAGSVLEAAYGPDHPELGCFATASQRCMARRAMVMACRSPLRRRPRCRASS